MGRWRWLSIAIPVAVIAVLETLSDSIFDELLPFPVDTILVVAVIAVVATVGGRLAWQSIDRLTDVLERRNRELEARAATTRALHQVGIAIAALADLGAILRVIVDSARELLHADLAALVRTGSDGLPHLAAWSGAPSLLRRNGDGSGEDVRAFLEPGVVASELAAPLRLGDGTIGTLAVVGRSERSFTIDEIETLGALANQASIAIENARLHDQLQELAVRGERERIARELHDGLAQVLSYVNTKSQAVEELIRANRGEEARAHLAELASAARSVYVDVREAILGLSSPVVEGISLARTIEHYAERFAESSKLAVRVTASDPARRASLAPAVEAQGFRIVQEALTNVRKHATAQRVEIELDVRNGELVVEVRDDGRGFETADASTEAWPRYGVTSMRDRAASVEGAVAWTSEAGRGTTVRLTLPLEAAVGTAGAR